MEKLKIVFIALACICLAIPCFARRNIELAGSWKRIEKSCSLEIPIQVWLEDNNKDIVVHFLENLGIVDVSILASNGSIIYNTTIEATRMSLYSVILAAELKKGEYEIVVSNEFSIVKGMFIVKD